MARLLVLCAAAVAIPPFPIVCCLALAMLAGVLPLRAQVGIGTASPSPHALLELSSADKGLLLPRFATADSLAATAQFGTPEIGMVVMNRNPAVRRPMAWDGGAWRTLVSFDDQTFLVGGPGLTQGRTRSNISRVGVRQPAPTSTLHVGGSVAVPVRSFSGFTAYTLTENDYLIIMNGSVFAGSELRLPPAASCPGRVYKIHIRNTFLGVNLLASGGDLIVDGNNEVPNVNFPFGGRVELISNGGSLWFMFND